MIPARRAGYALCGLACVLIVIAAISTWRGVSRLTASESKATTISAAAATFVTRAGTSAPQDADGYARRLAPLAGGALLDALTQARVDPVVLELRRTVTTRVESVAITSHADDRAVATVRALQSRRWVDGRGRVLSEQVRQHTSCRLTRVDGRWLVVEVRLLAETPARPPAAVQ